MQKVVSVAVMRQSDAETIRRGTSGRELMLRAGQGVLNSHVWQGPVAIVCGSGSNGGDGYVLALLLQEKGISCTVFLLSDRFSEDGRYYYEQCLQKGVKIEYFTESTAFFGYREVVDCILGTGFSGEVTGLVAAAVKKMNESEAFVISVDINSGLDGDNGLSSLCVHSDLTVSIGFYKSGHFLNQAKDVIGSLVNIDIGIDLFGDCFYLAEAGDFQGLFPMRRQNSHKGNYGYIAILGGCTEYAGAAKLANLSASALRAGCGVATLIVPESIVNSVSPYLLESTLATLPDEKGHVLFDSQRLDDLLAGKKALAIGMGWGKSSENAKILAHVLKNHKLSLVIDADGLNTLAEMDKELLKSTECAVLLTPHLKEFERISGYSMAEIQGDPIGCAKAYAKKNGVCVLLKGACTVVTDGNETILVNRGCAGMATAGSGDVLSGILAGLLGYSSVNPLTAACGAYIAGLAGERAEKEKNPVSMIASDTVGKIPEAVSMISEAIRS